MTTIPTQPSDLAGTAGPTREDGAMLVQLAHLGAAMELGAGTAIVWADDFPGDAAAIYQRYPQGSDERTHLRDLCAYMETVGTLVKNGLFDRKLCHDWLGAALLWDRIKPMALAEREGSGEPRLWENFEWLAADERAVG